MVKIKLVGLPKEVEEMLEELKQVIRVLCSSPYQPVRASEYVKLYLECAPVRDDRAYIEKQL